MTDSEKITGGLPCADPRASAAASRRTRQPRPLDELVHRERL